MGKQRPRVGNDHQSVQSQRMDGEKTVMAQAQGNVTNNDREAAALLLIRTSISQHYPGCPYIGSEQPCICEELNSMIPKLAPFAPTDLADIIVKIRGNI